MITESDIENYPGMALRSLGAGRFKTELWDTDKFFIKGGKTPWRIVTVCRSLEELIHCRVITHSAAPSSGKYTKTPTGYARARARGRIL